MIGVLSKFSDLYFGRIFKLISKKNLEAKLMFLAASNTHTNTHTHTKKVQQTFVLRVKKFITNKKQLALGISIYHTFSYFLNL
jgi:hypothetical protein